MGLFHKDVNDLLAEHVRKLDLEGLVPPNWFWFEDKLRKLEKLDESIITELLELHKEHKIPIQADNKFYHLLEELHTDLEKMLKQHPDVGQQEKEAEIVNNLLKEIDKLGKQVSDNWKAIIKAKREQETHSTEEYKVLFTPYDFIAKCIEVIGIAKDPKIKSKAAQTFTHDTLSKFEMVRGETSGILYDLEQGDFSLDNDTVMYVKMILANTREVQKFFDLVWQGIYYGGDYRATEQDAKLFVQSMKTLAKLLNECKPYLMANQESPIYKTIKDVFSFMATAYAGYNGMVGKVGSNNLFKDLKGIIDLRLYGDAILITIGNNKERPFPLIMTTEPYRRVITTLIDNALQHAYDDREGKKWEQQDKEIIISAEVNERKKIITVYVQDNGNGIDIDRITTDPKDKTKKLLFTEGASTKSDDGNPHGTGLYSIRAFVQKHGGEMDIVKPKQGSLPQQGTKFYFTIPYKRAEEFDADMEYPYNKIFYQ